MPPLPEAIIPVLAPFAPLFSHRVWCQAQVLLLGALLTSGARPVTAALRVMGLAMDHHFTNDPRVWNRATWSARQGSQMLLGLLITLLVPPGATIVLGADDTVERRSGRKIRATGCSREAVRSSKGQIIRCCGLKWVSMLLLVPVPWSRRVWALPFLTALARPADKDGRRRHKTSIDWVRHMTKQGCRWLPGRQLVLVVDGGFAAVSLALACGNNQVIMVSRWRWEAALSQPPGPQPPGKRGPKPLKGARQRRWQDGADRTDTPWQDVAVVWYGGQRKPLWVFSHTALWDSRGLPPVAIRDVLVCAPEGKLRMEALFCTDVQATPAQILERVVMRWSVEVMFEEARAHLGVETPRPWSDHAIARTTPVLLALFSIVTLMALRLSQHGPIPLQATAWYHKAEPTVVDCLTLVQRHLWCARYVVNSAAEADCVQFPREVVELLMNGFPLAA
jgi:hypothetical protein